MLLARKGNLNTQIVVIRATFLVFGALLPGGDQRRIVDETDVKFAAVTNEQEDPWVRLTLTDEASGAAARSDRRNIRNRIAVVLNARLIAVPLIKGLCERPGLADIQSV